MYLLGYSLDNLSLMALTISTGFVVDDAIVMIENINRFLEEGMPPLEAALTGAGQIGFTIVSLTVSLIAVLIPLLFMGDVVGRLFREFAVTLAVTIVISAVVSLTLTPMMCSRILRHDPKQQEGRFYQASERVFNRLIAFYGRTLRVVLRYQTITLLVAVATLVLTIVLYIVIPKGFFPVQDTGVIQGISQASQSISFDAMSEKQQELAKIILKDPAVESLSSFIGADGINTTLNSGRISINLKPINQRVGASDVIRRLQQSLAQVHGMHLYMQPVQDITVDDRVSRTQYQYTLEDPDTDELNEWTNKFVAQLKKMPELEDVATDQQTGARAIQLAIDRVTASRLGIAPTTIDNTLYDAYGQREISTLYTQLNQYHVILETAAAVAEGSQKAQRSLHSVQRFVGRHRRGRGHFVFFFGFLVGRIERTHVFGALHAVLAGCHRAGHALFPAALLPARHPASPLPPRATMPFRSAPSRRSATPPRRFPSITRGSSLQSPSPSISRPTLHWEPPSATSTRLPRNLTFLASLAVRFPGHRRLVPELPFQRIAAHSCRPGHCLHCSRRSV